MIDINQSYFKYTHICQGVSGRIEASIQVTFNKKKKEWIKSWLHFNVYDKNEHLICDGIPSSSQRVPSTLVRYLEKHPEPYGSINLEDLNYRIKSTVQNFNDSFRREQEDEARKMLHDAFSKELSELLAKYKAKIVGSCWSDYDPARGYVSVKFDADPNNSLELLDLDSNDESDAEWK